MMIIYIVRHGQTEENLQRILQGHMPGTLTEKGKEQVRKTAELLAKEGVKFTKLVSSDLKRAMDSAHIIQTDSIFQSSRWRFSESVIGASSQECP